MSHKRKSDGHLPPSKKSRTQNNGHGNSYPERGLERDGPVPQLPPINPEFEPAVFTHQGAVNSRDNVNDMASYERLEFLGDAYIEVFASRLIFSMYRTLAAGRLSQIREMLVKNETLAEFTVMYGFDKKLKALPNLEGKPHIWKKIKGDVFEAYVAAVILSDPDGGFDVAEQWLTQLWRPRLKEVQTHQPNLKAKEELARKVMAPGIKVSYIDERPPVMATGKTREHTQTHFVGVYLTGYGWEKQHLGSGKGLNKVEAGNEAAARAVENHPLIDEIVAKRAVYLEEKAERDRLSEGTHEHKYGREGEGERETTHRQPKSTNNNKN